MAIIKCPECNESISSTVKQCIHCGAKITACPECGTVYAEEITVCRNCGYTFDEEKPLAEEPRVEAVKTDMKGLKKKWVEENPIRKLLEKPFIVEFVFGALCLILLFIALDKFNSWTDLIAKAQSGSWSDQINNSFEAQITADKTLETIRDYIFWIVVALMLSNCGKRVAILYSYSDFSKWLRGKRISLGNVISDSLNADNTRLTEEAAKKLNEERTFFIKAQMFSEDIVERNGMLLRAGVNEGFNLLQAIFGSLFISANLEVLMRNALENGGVFVNFELSMLENIWQAVACIALFIIGHIYGEIEEKKDAKAVECFTAKTYKSTAV